MPPAALWIVIACVVALTIALVAFLLSLRKTVARAESVLARVEREIGPLTGQITALSEDLRALSREVTREVERIGVVAQRVEEATVQVARIAGVVASLTRMGQIAGLMAGVKTGLNVFVRRLKR
jgi:uncharacterized protein YoxC